LANCGQLVVCGPVQFPQAAGAPEARCGAAQTDDAARLLGFGQPVEDDQQSVLVPQQPT
jgi:hypothetical protein